MLQLEVCWLCWPSSFRFGVCLASWAGCEWEHLNDENWPKPVTKSPPRTEFAEESSSISGFSGLVKGYAQNYTDFLLWCRLIVEAGIFAIVRSCLDDVHFEPALFQRFPFHLCSDMIVTCVSEIFLAQIFKLLGLFHQFIRISPFPLVQHLASCVDESLVLPNWMAWTPTPICVTGHVQPCENRWKKNRNGIFQEMGVYLYIPVPPNHR